MRLAYHAGVFLVSAAALAFEVTLTRVFQIALGHHLAFMIVSIALLGYGASGTVLNVWRGLEKNVEEKLVYYSLLFTLSCLTCFIFSNRITLDPYQIAWDSRQALQLTAYYLVLTIPFIFSGLCVVTTFHKLQDHVGGVYCSSMLGSGLGCIAALVLLGLMNPGRSVAYVTVIGALSVLAYSLNARRLLKNTAAFTVVIALALYFTQPLLDVRMSEYKPLEQVKRQPDTRILYTGWNSISRVDVVESPFTRYAPGLSLTYMKDIPPHLSLMVDGSNPKPVLKEAEDYVAYTPLALPYTLTRNPRVLVLGVDDLNVHTALHHNSTAVDVIEPNPLVSKGTGMFAPKDKRVTILNNAPRSFLSGSESRYDLIVLPIRESVSSASQGFYSLNEDHLLTVEALQEYLKHLDDDGLFTTTGWLKNPPRECPRITALALTALRTQGFSQPGKHIALIRTHLTYTMIVKKSEFTAAELEAVRDFTKEMRYDVVYLPGMNESEANRFNVFPEPVYHKLAWNIIHGRRVDHLFNLNPVYDDRPYFHTYVSWNKIPELYESVGGKWQPFFETGFIAAFVLLQSMLLSAALILLPLAVKTRLRVPFKPAVLAYFTAIGLAYMSVEVMLMQKLVLMLGQPLYSITLVIATLLVSSGLGSLASTVISRGRMKQILFLLFVLLVFYSVSFSWLVSRLMPFPFALRLGAGILLTALPGFLMGMPFPMGLDSVKGVDERLISWAWCINGCASVVGASLALLASISLGYSTVLGAAGFLYMLSALTPPRS
jgi:hypothetical protein